MRSLARISWSSARRDRVTSCTEMNTALARRVDFRMFCFDLDRELCAARVGKVFTADARPWGRRWLSPDRASGVSVGKHGLRGDPGIGR